ncbi:uncharacterized protein LOC113290832 [Papaver somniferum]|uniref:uncharacterized protein LOC113290832 n=1 Tax=Papaver somniferum TaxID=3469 RepID=UPI000E6F8185|nr:uncharacterized protein LOC113290832 [Papaver somniferum]
MGLSPPPGFCNGVRGALAMYSPRMISHNDKLLLSGIISSLSQSVHTQMLGVTISRKAWQRLERIFASNSQAHMMQLQLQLVNTKKGALSILDYLTKMIFMLTVVISRPISDSQLVLYVLNGLGPEYGPFVTAMTNRKPFSASHAQNCNQQPMPNRGGSNNTHGRGRGRGRGGNNNHPGYRYQPSPASICQICNRYGHTALNYYNHFNEGGNRSDSAAAKC